MSLGFELENEEFFISSVGIGNGLSEKSGALRI
jgi:hypothetical protein